MIRNLNQLNFREFGTVLSERPTESPTVAECGQQMTLQAGRDQIPVYHTRAEVKMFSGTSMTVLSVSTDGEVFQHYYLDKSLCLKPNIWFYIAPFQAEAVSAELYSDMLPQLICHRSHRDSLPISNHLRVTELYTFFYHEKEQGFFFPGEAHPMLELTYVDQGSIHSVVDGQDLLLQQGDMTVYGANQWHMQYADMDVAPRYITISFTVDGSDLAPLLGRKFTPPQSALALLQKMLREQESMDPYATDMIISQLTLLLLTLLRHNNQPAVKLRTSHAVHSENEIIRRAQQYISSHIREKLSVPTVAQMVNVSPSYLTALFHKNLQISPGEYIRRIKLQESKQMIRENSMNFTQIAAALQYSTVHHFSRQFKEKFGVTPTEYARSVR